MTTYDTQTRRDDADLRDEAPEGYDGQHVADETATPVTADDDVEIVDEGAEFSRPEARGDAEPIELEERDGVYVPAEPVGTAEETEDGYPEAAGPAEFRPETDEAAPLSEHLQDDADEQPQSLDEVAEPAAVAEADEDETARIAENEQAAEAAIGVAAVPEPGEQATPESAPMVTLWPEGVVDSLRERWQERQLRFVDDPAAVTAELRDLVGIALQTLQGSLADRHGELDRLGQDAGTDTERLRVAVQHYRDFFDLLLQH